MHPSPTAPRIDLRKALLVLTAGLAVWMSPTVLQAAEALPPAVTVAAPGSPAATLADNQAKGIYTFLVLHRDPASTAAMTGAIDPLAKANGKAASLVASVDDPSLAAFLKGLKIAPDTVPVPVTLAVAPNGVVTGAFVQPPNAERFADAILPEQPLAVRKALSEGKAVVITMQSAQTTGNDETNQAIAACMADPKNKDKVVTLPVAMDKAENVAFLGKLGIVPAQERQSVVICMVPPLKIASKPFRGPATKDIIAATISSSCASGCSTGS